MSWIIHEKEYEAVILLPAAQRYSYFVKRVADWESVWSLSSEGSWALAGVEDGTTLVPVWPHERFALGSASGPWSAYHPREIDLAPFMERWLPGMDRDGREVAVFPTPKQQGVRILPTQLRADILAALEQLE